MVGVLQMAELVNHHIVEDFRRGHDQAPVVIDSSRGRTAAPAAFLIPQAEAARSQLHLIRPVSGSLFQFFFGLLPVPQLQGADHLGMVSVADQFLQMNGDLCLATTDMGAFASVGEQEQRMGISLEQKMGPMRKGQGFRIALGGLQPLHVSQKPGGFLPQQFFGHGFGIAFGRRDLDGVRTGHANLHGPTAGAVFQGPVDDLIFEKYFRHNVIY